MQEELNKEEKEYLRKLIVDNANILRFKVEYENISDEDSQNYTLKYNLLQSINNKLELDK